jgi:hypothetical protein
MHSCDIFALSDNDILITRYLKEYPSAAVNQDIRVCKHLAHFIGNAVRPDSPHLLALLNFWTDLIMKPQAAR